MKSYRSQLRLKMSGPRTDVRGSSWSRGEYPTPSAVRYGTGNNGDPHDGRGVYATAGRDSLDSWARKWSPPTSTEHKAEHSVNPEWNSYRKGLRLSTQTVYWPTTTTDAKRSGAAGYPTTSRHGGTTLTDAAVRGHGHPALETSPGGRTGSPLADLNPLFAAVLMGFPVGWLDESGSNDSRQLATQSSPSASRSLGASSESWQESEIKGTCKNCNRNVLYQGAEYCSPACCAASIKELGDEQRSALLTPDGVYRYLLARIWGSEPRVLFIGLNPSTADAEQDDPTVNWWREFAQRHGYGGFVAANLFAFRTSNPKELKDSGFLVGGENDYFIVEAAKHCGLVVACWGNSGGRQAAERGHHIERLLAPQDIYFFEENTDGSPRHPLARGAHRLDPQEATLRLWSCPF